MSRIFNFICEWLFGKKETPPEEKTPLVAEPRKRIIIRPVRPKRKSLDASLIQRKRYNDYKGGYYERRTNSLHPKATNHDF
jgi:hypothetical protein